MAVWIVFGIVTVLVLLASGRTARVREGRARETLRRSVVQGLDQPPSLHPVIDPERCIGTGACVGACPEGDVLGLVDGRAVLIEPTRCIGHGECRVACPVDAITLVFGTATRGVEIPRLGASFETDVPGLYIAGELGGMGLIRNAMSQGVQAVEGIAREVRQQGRAGDPGDAADALDLVVVGAGPAGLAASLAAREAGLRFETLEQDELGGTVAHYPRRKLVMTAPVTLPLYGTLRLREVSKEQLLALWREIADGAGLAIRTGEPMEGFERGGDGIFRVRTPREVLRARRVLLAIGRRGTPRRLGVPGEDAPTVAFSLIDPADFRGARVLVVGGGNTALEAAAGLAEPGLGNRVALCHRGPAFPRAAPANRRRVEELEAAGRLEVRRETQVRSLAGGVAELEGAAGTVRIEHDQAFVLVGGVLPTGLLRELGVVVEERFGTA